MASLKPTMSSNGLKRISLQVSYRIDIDELWLIAANIMSGRGTRRVLKKEIEE